MRCDSPTFVAPAAGLTLSAGTGSGANGRVIELLQEVGAVVAILQAELEGLDGPVPQGQVIIPATLLTWSLLLAYM